MAGNALLGPTQGMWEQRQAGVGEALPGGRGGVALPLTGPPGGRRRPGRSLASMAPSVTTPDSPPSRWLTHTCPLVGTPCSWARARRTRACRALQRGGRWAGWAMRVVQPLPGAAESRPCLLSPPDKGCLCRGAADGERRAMSCPPPTHTHAHSVRSTLQPWATWGVRVHRGPPLHTEEGAEAAGSSRPTHTPGLHQCNTSGLPGPQPTVLEADWPSVAGGQGAGAVPWPLSSGGPCDIPQRRWHQTGTPVPPPKGSGV